MGFIVRFLKGNLDLPHDACGCLMTMLLGISVRGEQSMNIIQQAQAKREVLQRELARIEAFLATAYELQQELGGKSAVPVMSDAAKADAPVGRSRAAPTGSGTETLKAVVDILRERGRPMSTRDLLPLVQAKGIQVGGKSPLATLSARISQKGVVAVNGGVWWFIDDKPNSDGSPSDEKTADLPSKGGSAASLFQSSKENDAMPPP